MASTVNYLDTHFEKVNLTPIRGEPTYETFHKLWNEVKANARSVYSHIGGGTHDHLGLVLTDGKYSDISTTVFTCPAHPGPLSIPSAATVVQRSTLPRHPHRRPTRFSRGNGGGTGADSANRRDD